MSIGVTVTIQQRLWRGSADPGLPVGAYVGAAQVTGDATGGVQFVRMTYKGEGEPVSGRYYNIEQITSHILAAVTTQGSMIAGSWDQTGAAGLSDRTWALSYVSDGVGAAGLASAGFSIAGKMPVFLGQPEPNIAAGCDVIIQQPNVLGRVLFATLQGYIWEARSVMVDGGLRRPVGALYG